MSYLMVNWTTVIRKTYRCYNSLSKKLIISRALNVSSKMENKKKVAVIFGAGDGTGRACSKAFALEGYTVVAVRRHLKELATELNEELAEKKCDSKVYGYSVDASNETDVVNLFDEIEQKYGSIHIALHNIGGPFLRKSVLETSVEDYQKRFEISATSSLIVGKEAARRMVKTGNGGCIFFTGATASLRGNTNFSAFASAMSAKRIFAQSMAKEFGPQGIHVAHTIIDGVINTPFLASDASPFPRDLYNMKLESGGLIQPESIAQAYVYLSKQTKDAWTFEMDLRPWNEKW